MKKHDINIEYVSSISIINITETKSFEKYEKLDVTFPGHDRIHTRLLRLLYEIRNDILHLFQNFLIGLHTMIIQGLLS